MFKAILRWFKRIPFIEATRAFMEQWGIWAWIVWLGSLVLAGALAVWAFVSSHLPAWAIALVFMGALVLLAALSYYSIGALARVRSLGEPQMQPIDRLALADEAERLARNVGTLLADHAARQILARDKDTAAFMRSKTARNRGFQHGSAESAKTIEKFTDKYVAETLLVFAKARKCIHISDRVIWHMSHISEHDLHQVQAALIQLSVDLRHSQPDFCVMPSSRAIWVEGMPLRAVVIM